MTVPGGTKKLSVIGDPIAHSLSPLIHNAMLKKLGLDYVYSAELVKKDELGRWIDRAAAEGFAGFNATMPHKTGLLKYMDRLSGDAALYGSVNTVRIDKDGLYGFNTDGNGFIRALADFDISVKGMDIVALGAGGASNSVVLKAAKEGARSIVVLNRNVQKAEEICRKFPEVCSALEFTDEILEIEAGRCDLLVNCTPLGMAGTPADFINFSFLDKMKNGAVVYDLIYNPRKTQLLENAGMRGLAAENGLGMLIYQAIFALEIFTGIKVDSGKMKRELESILH